MISFENSTLYYYTVGTRGRAEAIRFLLRDAGVNYQDFQFSFDEWNDLKPKLMKKFPMAVLPCIETQDGQFFGSTVPLLRILGKELGYYPTGGVQDDHFIENTADLASDWVSDYCKMFYCPNQLDFHLNMEIPLHLSRLERIYGAYPSGPYALGNEITYADFLVYHILYQEKFLDKLHESNPNLEKFARAFEERPKMKAYLATLPKNEPEIYPTPPKELQKTTS
ncbi:hypothetical protein BDA99DRAFT_495153 [Phascolomyces articulosus]|uniref:Glutathione transferase n=1 Tax=Phascolomyces articulosus TaxID=60185 RepID=A0AAD5KBT3_9FUNG|nr:hypothetical protein BDA99DRAFT_495153 [Phascolomyces articulosus]